MCMQKRAAINVHSFRSKCMRQSMRAMQFDISNIAKHFRHAHLCICDTIKRCKWNMRANSFYLRVRACAAQRNIHRKRNYMFESSFVQCCCCCLHRCCSYFAGVEGILRKRDFAMVPLQPFNYIKPYLMINANCFHWKKSLSVNSSEISKTSIQPGS